jgi:hypothetical protein
LFKIQILEAKHGGESDNKEEKEKRDRRKFRK